jgi:epoxyqueuosine reductase
MKDGTDDRVPGTDTDQKTSAQDLAGWVAESIRDFCRNSPENRLKNRANDRAYNEPLVGFSSGADPLYEFLQKDIGAPWMTPSEIFRKSFPESDARTEDLTVISWVLPHIPATVADNARQKFLPSERWVRAKHAGSAFSKALSLHVVELLKGAGYEAITPQYAPFWFVGMSKKYGLASAWSERHAAYVSGLGTFGLCDGLITQEGQAIICGSVITRFAVPSTPRPYTDHHAYCLHYTDGTCGRCISRCPVKAVLNEGHNKTLCFLHCMVITKLYVLLRFGINDYGCGMCQTGVPCDRRNPVKRPPGQ